MSKLTRGFTMGAVAATAAASLAACGSSSSNPLAAPPSAKGTVVVGSANFPEDELIAEIYTLALQNKGVKVTQHLNIGAREIYYPQVVKGGVSIIPEYNGALLFTSVDPSSTAITTSQVNAALAAKLPPSVEILNSAPAQDKDSVTVTAATASRYHLKSISDLAAHASQMVIGGPPEFKTRHEGLLGLESVYGLHFKAFQPLDEAGPVTFAALQGGRVQAADVFTTTPQILTNHWVVLSDPKNLFAAQNVTPLVYKKAMNSTIVNTLNAVDADLTTQALLQMDQALSVQHAGYSQVASGFLKAMGLG
jgi:osmoprotectant transport system substrate-binding protein